MNDCRVAVTSDGRAATAQLRLLAAAGMTGVHLPCIRVEPPTLTEATAARQAVAGADMAVVTSARAIELLWPGGDMPPVDVAAVGEATARAVEAAGARVTVAGKGTGDELTDTLARSCRGRRLVLVVAAGAGERRAEQLRAAGADVRVVVAYRTGPVAPGPDPVDTVLFGSPSAVRGWLLSRQLPETLTVGAIGPTTAAELRRRGRAPDVVAGSPEWRALVAAVASQTVSPA